MYICMDENPDYIQRTHVNLNGSLFYFVKEACGALPCKPYIVGHELTCAECTPLTIKPIKSQATA